jgi:hypothetical protein
MSNLPDVQLTCYQEEETYQWKCAAYLSYGPVLLFSKFFTGDKRDKVLIDAIRWATFKQDTHEISEALQEEVEEAGTHVNLGLYFHTREPKP